MAQPPHDSEHISTSKTRYLGKENELGDGKEEEKKTHQAHTLCPYTRSYLLNRRSYMLGVVRGSKGIWTFDGRVDVWLPL